MSEDMLRGLLRDCGFACGEPITATDLLQAGAEYERHPETAAATAGHATAGHEMGAHEQPATAERGEESATREHALYRGGMAHDMSDPAMAEAMEADMRTRFFVALVLTVPIVLYSSLGTSLLHLHLPTPFSIPANWLLLVLTTPVVWWCGWIFHSGAGYERVLHYCRHQRGPAQACRARAAGGEVSEALVERHPERAAVEVSTR
ncbi:MAG: hypothetical protein ACLQUY_06415 [Ktedonobacterales bacterium]